MHKGNNYVDLITLWQLRKKLALDGFFRLVVWNPGGKAAAEVGIEPNIAGITNGEPNETR